MVTITKECLRRVSTHFVINIALVCGLNLQVGCQDRLRVNSDADEALA